jgi:hypothetical protein
LCPKGTGALLADIPDSASTGGNKRGANAVDLQTWRGAADQVASGTGATIAGGYYGRASGLGATVGGGYNNVASGQLSTIAGGANNTASGVYSVAFGFTNTASGQSAFAGGNNNTASGVNAVAFGNENEASGDYNATVSGGYQNIASGRSSWVPGGWQATTRGLLGSRAYASGQRSARGDRQVIGQPVSRTTTDATTTTLTADASAVGATNVLVLPNNSSLTGLVQISASDSSGNCASWLLFCRVSRGANAASTAVDFQTTVASNLSAALSTATAVIAADTTQGALVISVTGVAATTIDWIADPSCLQLVR